MKKIALLMFLVIFVTAGCIGSTKDRAWDYFYSDSNDTYMIHLYYENRTSQDMELLSYMNSSDELLKVIKGIQVYDVTFDFNQKRAKKIGVKDFPMMVVTNDTEIRSCLKTFH